MRSQFSAIHIGSNPDLEGGVGPQLKLAAADLGSVLTVPRRNSDGGQITSTAGTMRCETQAPGTFGGAERSTERRCHCSTQFSTGRRAESRRST